MSKWVSMKTNRGSYQRLQVSINCYSCRAYAQNSVKWPERVSDHKTLYNVEKTCAAIILSLYMILRAFKWPQLTHLVRS